MSVTELLDTSLTQLFADCEDDLCLDDKGMLSIAFGGNAILNFQADDASGRVLLWSDLSSAPNMSEWALKLNMFHSLPAGTWLARNENGMLSLCTDAAGAVADPGALGKLITQTVETAESLLEQLKTAEVSPERLGLNGADILVRA